MFLAHQYSSKKHSRLKPAHSALTPYCTEGVLDNYIGQFLKKRQKGLWSSEDINRLLCSIAENER